jgi:hypothetical protein
MSNDFIWTQVGDLQIPYEDKRAVALWFKVMKWLKPASIDFVGDIDDQLEYSTYSDGTTDDFFNKLKNLEKENDKATADYEKALVKYQAAVEKGDENIEPPLLPGQHSLDPLPFIVENAKGAREFYQAVRKQHPNTEMHANLGNHDIRIFKYVDRKAPDYIEQVTPNSLWGLDDAGITWSKYEKPPVLRHAGIYTHHGATTTDTGLAVRGDIEKYNISLIRGHDHRGGVVYKSYPLSGNRLVGMGTGHLCDPAAYGLQYTFNPAWEMGFGIAHVSNDYAHLQFIHINSDYECYVDGKKFQG